MARDPGEYSRSKGAPFNGARGGRGDLLLEPPLPLGEVSRHHSKTPFKILFGLPRYGLSALPFPEDGQGSFSEGLVVKFFPPIRMPG
jgi:hypothetical protein